MSKLTWADVKVGEVIEMNEGWYVLKYSPQLALWGEEQWGTCHDDKPIIRILGRFDELGCKLDLDNGGFTIPDEVMEGEQGEPAVKFKPGEWFETRRGRKHLKCEYGAFYIDKRGNKLIRSDSELNQGCYLDCHPCEPDFFIFTEGELRDVKEQEYLRGLQDRKELREADGIDEGEDSATVEPERVNIGLNDTPEDDSVGELIEYVWKEWKSQSGGGDNRVTYDLKELQSRCSKARDQYERQQKPTIPQEVREFFRIIKDWDALNNAYKGSPLWRRYEAALQALGTCESSHGNRCEVTKPHPLTKVRELVEYVDDFIHNNGKRYGMFETLYVAARRELAEYDGEVGDE